MKYRKYIKDSVDVSEVGLGAWQLGQNSGWSSKAEKEEI
jgi:aryl-alcohol dehydrogenase-like predicted oxidoreductase